VQEGRSKREAAERALADSKEKQSSEARAFNKSLEESHQQIEAKISELDVANDARLKLEENVQTCEQRIAQLENDRLEAEKGHASSSEQLVEKYEAQVDALKLEKMTEAERLESIAGQATSLSMSMQTQVEKMKEELKDTVEERDRMKSDVSRLTAMSKIMEQRFAEIAEQCQMIIGDRDALRSENEKLIEKTKENDASLLKRENELRVALSKLSAAEEAVEGELTCMECLQLFENPTVCLPEGDTFCEACASKCEKYEVTSTVPNKQLATLGGKFLFMRQSIAAIKKMQEKKENQ
jgi:DNA repair exonuclease SbcCD ATPase subunit